MSVIIEKSQKLRTEIIKQLYYRSPLSLTELSRLTKKSLPSITALVNTLVAEGYVIDQGLAPSTGGRRAQMFLLNPKKQKFIVAVAMDQIITRMVIYNLANEVVVPVTKLNLDVANEADGVEKLLAFIQQGLAESGISKLDLLGVGIGMPGFVNAEKGVNYYLKPKNGSNILEYLSSGLDLQVCIYNDSSLIAMAEMYFGAAIDKKHVMVINIGWGTGLGMIVNGQLYRGSRGYAGEFSHIPLSASSNLCSCGKRGCLEVETSLLVMVDKVLQKVEEGAASSMTELLKDTTKHAGDHFLRAAREQDPLSLSVLGDAAFQLGKGISTLIHIMNPELIILSGRGARAGKMLLPPIQHAINEFCIPLVSDHTEIVVSELAENAELLAAAILVIENFHFEDHF